MDVADFTGDIRCKYPFFVSDIPSSPNVNDYSEEKDDTMSDSQLSNYSMFKDILWLL